MVEAKALLLLPPPPCPPTNHAIQIAFDPPLRSALQKLAKIPLSASTSTTLDIALPWLGHLSPEGPSNLAHKDPLLETQVRQLLSNVYLLLASICTQEDITTTALPRIDGKASALNVNARVILLTYDEKYDYSYWHVQPQCSVVTPMIDLPALALSNRRWTHLFVVEGERGQTLHRQFMNLVNGNLSSNVGGTWDTQHVPGGLVLRIEQKPSASDPSDRDNQLRSSIDARIVVVTENGPLTLDQKFRISYALFISWYNMKDTDQFAKHHHHSHKNTDYACSQILTFLFAILETSKSVFPEVHLHPVIDNVLTVQPFNIFFVSDIAGLRAVSATENKTIVIMSAENRRAFGFTAIQEGDWGAGASKLQIIEANLGYDAK
ncbi:hypothetical protein FQN57_001601 [Myotisia sp. PD_48]|nr:hypothetical protein FQN57_001601 [Myotisia sp. PD_48]